MGLHGLHGKPGHQDAQPGRAGRQGRAVPQRLHPQPDMRAGASDRHDRQLLARLGEANSQASVRAMPTDIFSRYQLSNIISPKKTTTEYLGRGGVVDFPRAFNLNEAQAEELTPHLPIFAEYTPTEGN